MVLYCFLKPKAHRRGMEIYIPIFFFLLEKTESIRAKVLYSILLL